MALFAFILPFSYLRRAKAGPAARLSPFHFNSAANVAILTALVVFSFVLANKTPIVAGTVVVAVSLAFRRSARLLALVVILFVLGAVVYQDYLTSWIEFNFLGAEGAVRSNLATALDFGAVARGYAAADPLSYFYGAYWTNTGLKLGQSPFPGELRGLGMPLSFGFGWALIVGAGMITMLRYSLTLIRTQHLQVFGMAFLGILIIYGADQHYPRFNTHGALELFFIAAGWLSSLRDSAVTAWRQRRVAAADPGLPRPLGDAPAAARP